jgi:hypothetical protein
MGEGVDADAIDLDAIQTALPTMPCVEAYKWVAVLVRRVRAAEAERDALKSYDWDYVKRMEAELAVLRRAAEDALTGPGPLPQRLMHLRAALGDVALADSVPATTAEDEGPPPPFGDECGSGEAHKWITYTNGRQCCGLCGYWRSVPATTGEEPDPFRPCNDEYVLDNRQRVMCSLPQGHDGPHKVRHAGYDVKWGAATTEEET